MSASGVIRTAGGEAAPRRRPGFSQLVLGTLAVGLAVLATRMLLAPDALPLLRTVGFACAGAALALALACALPAEVRTSIVVVLVTAATTLVGGELYLGWRPVTSIQQDVASRTGAPLDARTRTQVVFALRESGTTAYPAMNAWLMRTEDGPGLTVRVDGDTLLPLAPGLAGVTTVWCNESGPWVIYRSDERGFNNPPGLWNPGAVDLALVGDSFTQGECHAPDSSIAGRVRTRYPRTLNLGFSGSGPLIHLALMREYLADVRPRTVLWVYYEGNDLEDLRAEAQRPVLRRYLADARFRQGLVQRQAALDAGLRTFLDSMIAPQAVPPPLPLQVRVGSYVKLTRLRKQLGFTGRLVQKQPAREELAMLERTLVEARRTAESWGGRVTFVYLPEHERYAGDSSRSLASRGDVLRAARAAGLPVIDLHAAFAGAGSPGTLWVDPRAHFSDAGARVAATAILDGLDAVGPSPEPVVAVAPRPR